jgi:co-chaperonin GroES (HSP10)
VGKSKKVVPALDEFFPTEEHLLCEQVQEAERSGTIIIPDSVRVPLTQGVVLKAGTLCNTDLYKPGRIVIFRLHTEDRVTIGGTQYIIVSPANIILTGPIVEV